LAAYAGENLHDKVNGTVQLLHGLSRARDLDTQDKDACSAFLADVLQVAFPARDSKGEFGFVLLGSLNLAQFSHPAFERITGYAATQALGQSPKILWSGRIGHYATLFSNNTARNQLEAGLRELSSLDGLTGIANRRSFDEVLAREWSRALSEGRPLSLAMADIDHFKGYNDRHGHLAGDACLKQVAQAIDSLANRASDLAARYGGEEFALILPNADARTAAEMAARVVQCVAALALRHGASDTAATVTVSVGVATRVPSPQAQPSELIAAADAALYQAKEGGRNRVVVGAPVAAKTPDNP
jgi:diguanylate cyclase (GGDEF)-like protein